MRFLIAGGTAAGVNIVFLYIFTEFFGWWYLFSATLSFIIAFIVSFLSQKFWVWNDPTRHRVHRQAIVYFAVAVVNLGLNNLILYILVDHIHIWYILGQAITSLIVAFWSFFIYKILFKPETQPEIQ